MKKKLNVNQIKFNINNKYPFIMEMIASTNSAHDVTCYGYRKRSDGYTTLIIWNSGTNATVTIGCNTGGGSYTSGTILHYNNNYYKWEYTVSQYE